MSAEKQVRVGTGTVVASYEIQDVLGVGGSGTVYRAKSQESGHLVALKVMNAEHLDDATERQRFEREAEVVKKLAHPHVVSLLDYGYADDLPYLVFPLLEGHTLEQHVSKFGKLDWGTTGRLSVQVLSALEVAHGMGIAHRDIKPANIFLCPSPMGQIAQILDFGTAKIVGESSQKQDVTRVGVLVGTPRYMAPEQVRGEPLTPAADVYAFGLVMAEMLLGRALVGGAGDFDIYVLQGSDREHALPDEILASPFSVVIERAIAKPLEVRYRLASQMLADVRSISERLGQGEAKAGEADMEATCFIGMPQPKAAPSETAVKMRRAFNAIADKAAPPAPAATPAPLPVPPPPPPAPKAELTTPVAAAVGPPPAPPPPQAQPTQPMPPTPQHTPLPHQAHAQAYAPQNGLQQHAMQAGYDPRAAPQAAWQQQPYAQQPQAQRAWGPEAQYQQQQPGYNPAWGQQAQQQQFPAPGMQQANGPPLGQVPYAAQPQPLAPMPQPPITVPRSSPSILRVALIVAGIVVSAGAGALYWLHR